MSRRPRMATGGLVCHVLNRRVGRLPLLEDPEKDSRPLAFDPVNFEIELDLLSRLMTHLKIFPLFKLPSSPSQHFETLQSRFLIAPEYAGR